MKGSVEYKFILLCRFQNTFNFISAMLLYLEMAVNSEVFLLSNQFCFGGGLGGRALSGFFFLFDLCFSLVNIVDKNFQSFFFLCYCLHRLQRKLLKNFCYCILGMMILPKLLKFCCPEEGNEAK